MLRYLNVGCGEHYCPEWTNVDVRPFHESVIACDIREGLPFNDASFSAVYLSQVLEHFSEAAGSVLLQECRRVLCPTGVIRVAVPDLENIAETYLYWLRTARRTRSSEAIANRHWMVLELVDQMSRTNRGGETIAWLEQANIPNESFVVSRGGHVIKKCRERARLRSHRRSRKPRVRPSLSARLRRLRLATILARMLPRSERVALEVGRFVCEGERHIWMYDSFSLASALEAAGFVSIQAVCGGESRIPRLMEFRFGAEELSVAGLEGQDGTLVMEGLKPVAE